MDEPTAEDLTARARIRNAALQLFADKGIDRVSVRDIAKAAGVSSGLIRHHFGSKDGLRDACDSYAVERLVRIGEAATQGRMTDPDLRAALESMHLLHRYLGRAMIDSSPTATSIFSYLVDLAERWLTEHRPDQCTDVRALAAVVVGSKIGVLVMWDQVAQALGAAGSSAEAGARIRQGMVELLANPLIGPDLTVDIGKAFDQVRAQPPHTAAEQGSVAEGAQQ
ncbi:TetR/AcrR family transcriptional regulator [Actinomadura macra]|uniref:TetR/AcrR family transcriptional regulator n=1 Tax=Actinomadura macra TaxID=46164 RepID=UPI00083679FE|nr:TetR/AcrR family transcriptional regulator [Actinomadura macra]